MIESAMRLLQRGAEGDAILAKFAEALNDFQTLRQVHALGECSRINETRVIANRLLAMAAEHDIALPPKTRAACESYDKAEAIRIDPTLTAAQKLQALAAMCDVKVGTTAGPGGFDFVDQSCKAAAKICVDALRTCKGCGKEAKKVSRLMRCGGCMVAVYCNRDCQKRAWRDHKLDCVRIVAAAKAAEGLK